jgi:hypothetical protein
MMKKLMLAVAMACGLANAATPAVTVADQDAQAAAGFRAWLHNNKPLVTAVVATALVVGYGVCAYKSDAFNGTGAFAPAEGVDFARQWGQVLLAPLWAAWEMSKSGYNTAAATVDSGVNHVYEHKWKYGTGGAAALLALVDFLRGEESMIKGAYRSIMATEKKAAAEVVA